MSVLFRAMQSSDLDAALRINNLAAPAVSYAEADKFASLVNSASLALIAEVNGAVAGFCLVMPPKSTYQSVNYRWFQNHYEDFIYLDRVALDESFRGRGIGAALYAEIEKQTRARWFTLEVNLRPRNDGSLRFHERLGFVEVGQQETDYGCLVSLLAKDLATSRQQPLGRPN